MIRHRDIFNTVQDAIFIADANTGMIVDANRAAEALCGRSLEELRSMHHTQLHPPELTKWALEAFQRNTRVPGLGGALVLHKDGHRIPTEIACSHFTDADGRLMLVGVFRDTTERDRAREALRQSEERFRQVAESAGEFIWEVDAAGLYVYASPVVAKILGYTPEEIVGRVHFYDFFVPETREALKTAAFDIFARKEPFRAFCNWNVRKDGSIVALETSGLPVLDGNGNLLGYRGADTDITERERTETALRESEDRYRTLFDQAADCVFLLDLSAGVPVIVDVNEAAVKSHGYSRVEMIGQPLSLIEPKVSQESLDARMRLIAEGKPFYMVHRRKDGSTFEVESAARLVRIGAQEVLLAVGRDITERKQAERELNRQNEFIRAALDNIYDGVVACDAEGNLALFNRAAREFHGVDALKLPPDQWSSYYDLFGPDGKTPLATESIPLKRAFDGEHIHDFGLTIAAKGQPLRHVLASSCPFYDHDGNKLGAVAAMHDVTERKRIDQALRESEERFRVTFDQAAVGIAHVAPDGRFLRVNGRFCQIAGYSSQQMLERTFQEITHPDDLEADVQQMRRLLRGEIETYSMEKRYVRADGGLVWVDLTVALVRNGTADPDWFVAVVQETTRRKEAEDALRRSEERFRYVTENLQDAVWSADLSGQYEFLSPNMERLYGRPLAEMAANPAFWIEAVHPEDKATAQASGDALLRDGRIELEYRILLPDGTERWISDRKLRLLDAHGKPFRITGILSDITERKRTEEILAASEEKYRALIETTDTGYLILDMEGKVIDANQEYVRLTGHRELGEILGRSVLEWTEPDEKPKNAEAVARCVKDGFARNVVINYVDRNKRVTPVEINARVTGNGGSKRIISLCRDITERKQVEDALRVSEARFRALADSALVGIYILQDGKYTYVNPAMAGVFGYSVAEMTGMVPHDIVHPSHHEMVDENIRCRIEGQVHSMRYEVRGRYRDGSVRDVEVYGSTVELNGRPALLGTLIDITDRKRAEKALRESTQQILTIANCLPDVLWTMDLSGRFTYVSPRVEQMTGWTPEEFLKLTFLDTMTLAQRMKSEQSLRDELIKASSLDYNRNSVNTFESEELRKDGTTFWAEVSAALLWVDGSPAGVIGITRDITERKRQEREREHLQHELAHAQKMESVGRLAGGIAHDFNNMMSVVLMYADSALEELRSGESATDDVEAIRGAAERAIALGRQLMAFSSKQMLQPEILDLNSVVADCQKLLRRLIGEDVKVVFQPGPGLFLVKADRGQIGQILINLAVNSRDAMPEGGTFTVETSTVQFDSNPSAEAEPGSYVMLSVRDTGTGMDQETRERVFEPFFTTKEVGKGTGLGLAMVYGIVKQNGGYITFGSEPAQGCEFKIYLPLVPEKPKSASLETKTPISGGCETIFVVEDEPALRGKIQDLLRQAGYEVIPAPDGDHAIRLSLMDARPIHLLLTDVVMPGLSGFRLANRLRALRPHTKVLYMSGYPAGRDENTDVASLPNFIQKPFTKEKLLHMVRDVLDGKIPQDQRSTR